ncbi:MAG TPA: hypothetical protein VJU59_27425 [Paraburkholderia sp.]|uniref:hypothetical protein n=1 Tax=Paraburkholderia sp. TaxID=1926495 RepID=UPI002B48A54F|nr:hypothetical protein [Paraburkholderia sp.]HKR43370.1 hypothetical protein [Paraburkholderia sp.]
MKGRNDENATGFVTSGFITKKGAPSPDSDRFNVMPPGEYIEDQPNADIREMPMKKITPLGYPE